MFGCRVCGWMCVPVIAGLLMMGSVARAMEDPKKAEIGKPAPEFTLKSAEGKDVSLKDFKGKIVVLEWTSDKCPVAKHLHADLKTPQKLVKEYAGKNVVWLGIDSSSFANAEDAAKHAKTYEITYPILIDKDGKVGKAYGARTTPHMFVIDAKGNLAYMGAIDNNQKGDVKEPTNYVKQAVDALLSNSTVATTTTEPYGCSVKYAN